MTIVQWLVFRGVGHAQTGTNSDILSPQPVVACGRTSWPGLVKYQNKPPKHLCPECAAAAGLAAPTEKRQTVSVKSVEPAKPSQGNLF